MAKKGKKREKGRSEGSEFCDISEMGFKEMQFTEEETKSMQLDFDKICKDSEEFYKNLPDISSWDLREFNGSEDN